MLRKIIATVMLLIVIFPAAVSAKTDWGISLGGDNWGFNIGSGSGSGKGGGWGSAMSNITGYGLPQGSIMGIIENILSWLLALLGIAGVIGFAISGILYMVSTGDETMIDRAKTAMKWSIVGVIVGLLGVVVINAVNSMLNAQAGF